MGKSRKKQHYVPQMYLRNFNNGKENHVYEYNHYTKEVRNKCIDDLCEENYLYEIRDEEGIFIFPEHKNIIEKALGDIDTADSNFLRTLLEKIRNGKKQVILPEDERQSLLGFIVLMLLRNPVVRDTIPEALKISTGIEPKGRAEIQTAWIATMLRANDFGASIENSQIVFLKANNKLSFITSNMPMYFVGMPIQREFYMPLSPQIGVELRIPQNALINLNKCDIRELSHKETDVYNCKLLQREGSIISSSESVLKRYIDFMNSFDKSAVNPYVEANLKMLESMSPEDFRMLVVKLIDIEIQNRNAVFVNPYNALIKKGCSSESALKLMAEVIETEVRKSLLTNNRLDYEMCSRLLERFF